MRITTVILFIWTSTLSGQTNFQTYFDSLGLKGSTTIYDYKNQKWIFTDKQDAEIATLPASTFKIPNSLFILDYKAVVDENEIYKWDGKPKSHFGIEMKVWEKDTDLKNAYKNSTVWFYVAASQKISRKKYKEILRKIDYGNNNLNEKGADFWNYGDFAISPKNQVEFLIKLYENRLPFLQTSIDHVKRIMVSKNEDNYTFRDKTGWTRKNGEDIGWWVGYLTTDDNIYFFATRLIKDINEDNPDFLRGRKKVTKQILKVIEAY